MIDLTPLEVRKKKGDFRRVMRGYEAGPVDDFLDLAADRMDELVRENAQLNDRVRRLEEQVSDYRDRERALTEALVTAQEMREEMREQSSREAEIARREAEAQAERIRHDAELLRDRELESIKQLRERQHQLVAGYRALLERELAEINVVARTLEASLGGAPAAGELPAPPEPQAAAPPEPPAAVPEPSPAPPAAPRDTTAGPPLPGSATSPASDPTKAGPAASDAGEPTIFDLPLRSRKLFDAADLEELFDQEDSPLNPRAGEPDGADDNAPPTSQKPRRDERPFRFSFEDESP